MRSQQFPQPPAETFYFDTSQGYMELVVDQVALGDGPWPNVEVYTDRSVIMTVKDQEGELITRGFSNNTHRLYPGERILAIRTGNDEVQMLDPGETTRPQYAPGGEQTGEYIADDADGLIVKREFGDGSEPDKVMTFPVRNFLPGKRGIGYRAFGIVRPSGALVAWGAGAQNARRLTDLANASVLAQDKSDLRRLKEQLGRERHLVGLLNSSEQVSAYLGYFLNKFGVDFRPTHDPGER